MIIEEPGFFYESEVITLTTNNLLNLLRNYQHKVEIHNNHKKEYN